MCWTLLRISLKPLFAVHTEGLCRLRAGDFDAAAMRQLVERTLGGWRAAPGQPAQPPPVPSSALPPPPPGCVFLVDRPGTTQVPPLVAGELRSGFHTLVMHQVGL